MTKEWRKHAGEVLATSAKAAAASVSKSSSSSSEKGGSSSSKLQAEEVERENARYGLGTASGW